MEAPLTLFTLFFKCGSKNSFKSCKFLEINISGTGGGKPKNLKVIIPATWWESVELN